MRAGIIHGSIRKKLVMLFLLSASPAFLVILFFGLKAGNESTAAAEQNLKNFTRDLAGTQARTTASVRLLLETLAKVPEVRQAKAPACVVLFASLIKEHPHLTTINLVGVSGDLIASATGAKPTNFAHTKHFQDALKRKRFSTGEYLVGVTIKVPVFAFAYPLLDEQGQPKYFLLTSIRLDAFDRQFEKMSFPAESFVGVGDHRGLRLYRHPATSAGPLGQPIRRPVFEAAAANPEGLIEDTGSDGVSRIVAYSALRLGPDEPPYMYVFSGVPKSAIMAKAHSELIDNIGLFLLAVALALVSGWFFGGRALGMKLEKMAAAANRIGAGDLSARVAPDTDISEIATLARSFNSMAESLARDIFDRKKAEEILRESQEHLKSIFRVAPTGIGVVKNRILVQVNQRFCDMTGYAEEELLGQSARMVYPSQEDFDFVGQEKYRQISEKGTGEVETRFLRKDGAIIDVFMASTPLDPRDLSHGVTFTATDITERKKAEEDLHKSEARYQHFSSLASDFFHICTRRGGDPYRIAWVGGAFKQVAGYTPEELFRTGCWLPFVYPEDAPRVSTHLTFLKPGDTYQDEYRIVRKDGGIRWLRSKCRCEHGDGPDEWTLYGTALDVTERKLAEEALRVEAQRRRILMEKSSDGIATIGSDHRVVEANQRFADMLGYSRDEVLGLYTWDYEVLMTQEQIRASFRDFPSINAVFESRHRRRDGSVFDVEVSVSGVQVGEQPLVFAICRDITERKRAEETLRESESRFRMLFDNISSVAVQGYDQNRNVVYWNETSTRLYGYSKEEAIGQKLEDLIIPPQMRSMVIESITAWVEEDIAIPAGELGLMRKDGSIIAVFSSHVMQRFSDGRSTMYCLDIDLSELSVARAELVRAKETAEAANRSKSLFLANMSHELRTPLNGVLGMLQAIRGFGVSGEVELYTEMAIRAGQRLTGLLGDILDLSRIEAGRMPIASKPFALADIFTALAETFSPMHYSKSLSLVITASPDAPAQVVGDEVRVRQILFNLVGNAMKFSEKGEVRVDVSPLLPHPSGQARLLFIISDTGLGIPDDQIDEICRPFIQVSTDFTRSHQGAGLGLSIARRLIDAMGGTLTFESTEGQGTSVYLVLPLGIPENSALPATPESVHGAEPGASLRLLLVEDDEISRLSAHVSLNKMGHQVITANNGEEALEALRGSRYDCVLMDVQMDAMDGEEATRRIRSGASSVLDAHVPIIAMTAYAMPGDRERFLEAGMNDYVSKPVQVEELKKALARVAEKMGRSRG